MANAIGYVRRSTDRQEESLEQQKQRLASFAQSQGWQLVQVYEDDAISGSELGRAGLQSLLDRAQHDQNVELVLTWDRNRLARPKDPLDGMLLERQLTQAGKRVVYASTGKEASSDLADNLVSLVEHHQNGDYLRKLSRDSMRGIVSRVQQGRWPGGPIPFGYDRLLLDEAGQPRRIIPEAGSRDLHADPLDRSSRSRGPARVRRLRRWQANTPDSRAAERSRLSHVARRSLHEPDAYPDAGEPGLHRPGRLQPPHAQQVAQLPERPERGTGRRGRRASAQAMGLHQQATELTEERP